MHCYKIIITTKVKLQKLKFVTHLIIFVWLTFAFSLNKWHYGVLLIQLLRVLCLSQRIKNKQKLVKSYSLTSKLSTIKNHDM